MDCNLPSSSVHGIFRVRTLERIAIPCSKGSSWPRDQTWVSCTAGDSDTALTDSLQSEPLGKQVSAGVHACMLSCFSCVQLFATLWTIAHQAPLSLGFSRQECWNGLPFPSPGDLPNPGIKPTSLMSPASAGIVFITSTTWEAQRYIGVCVYLFKLVFLFLQINTQKWDYWIIWSFLIFWEVFILFSIVTASIYIPTNSARGFPFLQIFTNTCFLLFIKKKKKNPDRYEVISAILWFGFALPYGEGNGTPLQYFYLENPMDGGAW